MDKLLKKLEEDFVESQLRAVKIYRLIKYAMLYSDQTRFILPDGNKYTCDMGYVEDFMCIIEKAADEIEY